MDKVQGQLRREYRSVLKDAQYAREKNKGIIPRRLTKMLGRAWNNLYLTSK